MKEYHKINTVFQRDMETKHKTLLEGVYSDPAFEYLANNQWQFTEKVDGTNIRIVIEKVLPGLGQEPEYRLDYKGKTDNASIPAVLVTRLRERFDPQAAALFAKFPDGGCLYGEGYGARIQKGGGNYRPDADFVLFDVKVGDWWLQREAVEENAATFGLDIVPIVGYGTLADMVARVKEGFNSQWGDFRAEGLIAKPTTELKNRAGERIITKLKHKDFRS